MTWPRGWFSSCSLELPQSPAAAEMQDGALSLQKIDIKARCYYQQQCSSLTLRHTLKFFRPGPKQVQMQLHPFTHLSMCLAVFTGGVGSAAAGEIAFISYSVITAKGRRVEHWQQEGNGQILHESFCSTLPGFSSSDSHLSFEVFR